MIIIRKIVLFWALMAPVAAVSQEAPSEPFDLVAGYAFTWSGIGLGKVAVESQETPDSYRMRALVRSEGIANLFTKHKSDTMVEGKRAMGRYLPTLYETHYMTRKKPRHVKIVSNGRGKILQEVVEPEDRGRPTIPEDKKAAAYDILTTVFMIRQELGKTLKSGGREFHLDMYDGRRVTHLHFDVVGHEVLRISRKKYPVVHLVGSRSPGYGFTDKELGRMENEPKMDIYFNDTPALTPLAVQVSVYMGTLEGRMVAQCKTLEECF